ncbi:MAG: glycosyltransferase family 39 protein [Chloroflexota bacterium]
MKPSTRTILTLSILLLAAFLRFYRIDAQSFWNDEGNSARIAERSVDLIVAGAAGDIHPPGYYLLLAAWRVVAGHSEFALRGLSAFAGIILVALVYRLGKQYFDEPAALCAAFFAAIHPALIYYSQEARMYEMVAMWGAGAYWAVDVWLKKIPNTQYSILNMLAVSPVVAAGLYTHYSFAFIIIAINLLVLIRIVQHFYATRSTPHVLRFTFRWFVTQLAALLLFSPWLLTAIRQLTTWPSAQEYLPLGEAIPGVAQWLTLGSTIGAEWSNWVLVFVAGFIVPVAWRRRQLLPVLIWLIVPTVLTIGFGLFSQAFAKFLIITVPAVCLVMGHGMFAISALTLREWIWPTKLSRHRLGHVAVAQLAFVSTFCALLAMIYSLHNLYCNPAYTRADYRGIVRYLDSIAKPGDAILLNAPNQWEVVTYYHTDTSNVFPVARTRPLDVPAQIAELESIAATHDRLFVVYWGDAQSDPGRVIESWLNEHTFKAYDQWYGDVRLAAYAGPRAATTLQTRTDVTFINGIVLDGYSLNATAFSRGDILQLTLFWHAGLPTTIRYKVFVHIIGDPSLPPVAQHDGEPGGGLVLTTTWQPGQTVADNHGVFIPLDLPSGEYSLAVGLYGVDDVTRVTHPGGDSLFLSTITVK